MTQLRSEFGNVKGDTDEELRKRDYAEKELKTRIYSLEERLDEAIREKERMKSELNHEVERLSRTHQDTVNLLRDDNRELEKRYFDELSDKKRGDDLIYAKEREYIAEINSLKAEIMHLHDEINSLRTKRLPHDSTRKAPTKEKRSRSTKKLGRTLLNSDTEEDTSLMASRELDRNKLYELDIQGKNAKIMDMRGKDFFSF